MIVTPETGDGRTRRRRATMRQVQAIALDLFETRGFAEVTIEEIAAAAGVGPATVYRNFGSKERIVLWDDYDPSLFAELARRLPGDPVVAVGGALRAALAPVYAADRVRLVRRSLLIARVPAIAAAHAADLGALRGALARELVARGGARSELDAEVLAAALVGALDVAVTRWARGGARAALADELEAALDALRRGFSSRGRSSNRTATAAAARGSAARRR